MRKPMTLPPHARPVCVQQFRDNEWQCIDDVVSREVPVNLWYEGNVRRLWAWPDELADLMLGHVLLDMGGMGHKGIVEKRGEYEFAVRLGEQLPPASGDPGEIPASHLMGVMQKFMAAEGVWDGTGCYHRAGAYSIQSGTLLHRTEDIGRHNCIDRLAGWANRTGVDLSSTVLVVSARITASLCAKALRAGFRFMVSRSAVTTASVDMAYEKGATLIGFARDRENRFTVFTDEAGRITA